MKFIQFTVKLKIANKVEKKKMDKLDQPNNIFLYTTSYDTTTK